MSRHPTATTDSFSPGGILTTGADRFDEAEEMVSSGRREVVCFRELMRQFPESWIDRVSRQRLEALESA